MLLAFFDFESTNKDPLIARVTEIGLLLYDTEDRRITDHYSALLYDHTYPDLECIVAAMTGISDGLLKRSGKPPVPEFKKLLEFMAQADYIVGHNIRKYDLPLLKAELLRNAMEGASWLDAPNFIDTRFDIEYAEHIKTRKLIELNAHLGLPNLNGHTALDDCKMTLAIQKLHDLGRTIELAASKEVWVRADVEYKDREKAKEAGFFWDGDSRWWVKQVKELFLKQEWEKCKAKGFDLSYLLTYDGPKKG